MNYQITNNMGFNNKTAAVADRQGGGGMNSILRDNNVGDLLACTLISGGKEPVLDLNGVQIKTKATTELEKARPGDTIYLKIQDADSKQVSLSIVGVEASDNTAGLNAATSASVMTSTEQFSEMIKENLDGALDEKEAKENQKEILRSLSPEEIAKLKMMQIDVTNATLSDLMGMVITIRSGDHQQEVNEQLGDIVKATIGKLRSTLIAGSDAGDNSINGSDASIGTGEGAEAIADTANYRTGVSRLNSEGYVVNVPAPNTQSASRMTAAAAAPSPDDVRVTDEQMIYLVKNNLNLTIENIDIAKNSVNEDSPSKETAIDQRVWSDIYPQVTGIIESAGMSVTEQSLSGAQFMLKHELPVTVDSLRLFMSVNSLNQRGLQEAQVEANISEQIAMGNSPESAKITGSTIGDKAKQLVEKLHAITSRTVDMAVNQGKPLTISYLYNASMRNVDVKRMRTPVNKGVEGASLSLSGTQENVADGAGVPLSSNPIAVSARRQLEEIRLSMTVEAANRLVRQDINIDARPLSHIVEVLRNQENNYYENVVSAHDMHDIPDDIDLVKETLKETDSLKNMPAYALIEAVRRPAITVGGLYEAASHMKATLAGQAYETMMTKPRQDMGDSINEAFQNVDAILTDMNLDINQANQRAIRILAHNQMPLTSDNIANVKAVDAKVNQMFETLTPQIVLNLIRENKNPLNMTIDGLNQEIMQQREIRGITDEQKFSEFLYQLDKTNGITEDERKSFIGIYRLLDKVSKSHGKDIGAVVRNGQEVTLNNLFAADKSRRAAGMDVSVDDSFGERVDVSTDQKNIIDQINTAYNDTLNSSILRHIRPETLKIASELDYMNMSFEELNGIMRAGDTKEGRLELSEEILNDLNDAIAYEDEVATMLEANDMPDTVTNIIAAQKVMYGENGVYGMIRDLKDSLPKAARDRITGQEAKVLETLESKEDVMYGLENLRASLSQEIHAKESDGTITAKDIQALKYLNAGMPIAMRAVEQDAFSVPLVIGDSVSIMKVSILRDGSAAGEVRATMETERYGALEAYVHVTGNQAEGYIVTDEEAGQHRLEENELTLRSNLAKAGMEVRDIRLDGSKPAQYLSDNGEGVETSKLYQVAKQLLTAIKLMGVVADNYNSTF